MRSKNYTLTAFFELDKQRYIITETDSFFNMLYNLILIKTDREYKYINLEARF